jgi:prepilin-type N-terminal cleavage/methylation domain-containing protein/prepilin-type processing-associated H-X9-DG protein
LRQSIAQTKRGFTLLELLVVLAIIGTLTAMIFPVFNRVREVSRRATCLSNLHQLSLAFAMYLADEGDAFPNNGDPYLWMGRRWRWPLQPYLGMSLTRDPAHPGDPLKSKQTPSYLLCPSDPYAADKYDATSYGYTAAFYHTPAQIAQMTTEDLWKYDHFPCVTQRLSAVAYPSQKVLLAEWLTNHDITKVSWWDWRGGRNYLFVDGHAAYLPARSINPSVTHLPDPNLTIGGLSGKDVG